MLVLSRKPDQEFVFPQLGITVRVLSVQGNRVRVGITAPEEIRVTRAEIADPAEMAETAEARHALRNRLNAATLALHLVSRQIEAGRGTEAQTTLERALNELAALNEAVASGQLPVPTPAAVAHPSVLLVEDDENERSLLAGLLEMEGFDVATAADGLEALDYLHDHRPEFVLLDMRMPRCDGPTTLQRIRREPALADLKVYAVSATAPSTLNLGEGGGDVDDWFPKPLDPTELVRRLKQRSVQETA